MIIGCTNCKEQYSITLYEIQKLDHSVFKCKKCHKSIKITRCPHCKSYYSITYDSTDKSQYQITCVKCKKKFTAEFPVDEIEEKKKSNKTVLADKKDIKETKVKEKLFKHTGFVEKIDKKFSSLNKPTSTGFLKGIKTPSTFNLQDLLGIGMQSVTFSKMTIASIGMGIIFLLLYAYNFVINLIFSTTDPGLNPYINSFLNLIPVTLIFSVYVLTSSAIARMTLDDMNKTHDKNENITSFLSRSLVSVVVINASILLAVNASMILFGEIPIIGPVLFSLLFLPVYIVSLCIIVIIGIGFWFFPSIIASGKPGVKNNLLDFLSFIRRHNFKLVYIIPIITIISALIFSVFYFLHYGSMSLTILISNAVLSDNGLRIFASIPSPLLSLSDVAFFGTDAGIFRTLSGDLFFTHHIGGIILGIIFTVLSILLAAAFISVTATLSASFYVMMEKKLDTDNRSKIQLLLLLFLFLAVLFLFKKVFL
jgi:hypothetical protein